MKVAIRGAVAGLAGTAVMTAAFLAAKKAGAVPGELEPKEITENFEEKIGVRDHLPEPAFRASWIALHIGYGTASGAAYALAYALAQERTQALDPPVVLTGPLFGVSLWVIGYCGWLPLFGLYPRPALLPGRKVTANIVSHVVYGTTTATVHQMLRAGA